MEYNICLHILKDSTYILVCIIYSRFHHLAFWLFSNFVFQDIHGNLIQKVTNLFVGLEYSTQ